MDPHLLWHVQELLRRTAWLAEHQLKLDGLLQAMDSRLQTMEERLQALEDRLARMEDRPATQIDKIEYRFEQLKVDTLSGSLQIGLTQGAEGLIEELGAGGKSYQDLKLGGDQDGSGDGGNTGDAGYAGEAGAGNNGNGYGNGYDGQEDVRSSGEPYARVFDQLQAYLESGLYYDIDDVSARAGTEPEPALRERIAQDLNRQVRNRVLVYMKEIPSKEGPDEEAVRTIMDRIRADVRTGLEQFFGETGKENPP